MRQKGGTEDVEEVCHFFKSNFRDYPSRAPEKQEYVVVVNFQSA